VPKNKKEQELKHSRSHASEYPKSTKTYPTTSEILRPRPHNPIQIPTNQDKARTTALNKEVLPLRAGPSKLLMYIQED